MLLQSQSEKELECIDQIIKDAMQNKSEGNPTITDILHSYDNYISILCLSLLIVQIRTKLTPPLYWDKVSTGEYSGYHENKGKHGLKSYLMTHN